MIMIYIKTENILPYQNALFIRVSEAVRLVQPKAYNHPVLLKILAEPGFPEPEGLRPEGTQHCQQHQEWGCQGSQDEVSLFRGPYEGHLPEAYLHQAANQRDIGLDSEWLY